MYREKFAEQLREIRKKSGIRQKELAERLGLSSASVSQFMNGVALPNMKQLNTMLRAMNVPLAEMGKVRFTLMLARATGPEEDHSPDKLPEWPFEPQQDLPPLPDPAAGMNWGDLDTPDFVFAAPRQGEARGFPLLTLTDMAKYRPKCDLQSFAQEKMRSMLFRNFGEFEDVAIVQASGVELDMPYCGVVQLALVEEMPDDFSSLRLRRRKDGSWAIVVPAGADAAQWSRFLPAPPPDEPPTLWELPVLELVITPRSAEKTSGIW